LILQGLDPIKLVYDAYQLEGRLKLTVSAFNRLESVCQQGPPSRTRCFFPVEPNQLPVIIAPTHRGMARLSGPGKYRDRIPPKAVTNHITRLEVA